MLLDIEERIDKDFHENALKAKRMLADFEAKWKLSSRISRCIVFMAQGDIYKMKDAIYKAEIDWRDVIQYAESELFEFNKPFVN